MALSFSTSAPRNAPPRLRRRTIARRCVGGLISLAGAAILGMELIVRVSGAIG
ncbi:hypothetical protein D3C71_1605630 [compost metagenome]